MKVDTIIYHIRRNIHYSRSGTKGPLKIGFFGDMLNGTQKTYPDPELLLCYEIKHIF